MVYEDRATIPTESEARLDALLAKSEARAQLRQYLQYAGVTFLVAAFAVGGAVISNSLNVAADYERAAELTREDAVQRLQSALRENARMLESQITLRTIYVGDQPERYVKNGSGTLELGCDTFNVRSAAIRAAGPDLKLVTLDPVVKFSGGDCGHTFFSGAYIEGRLGSSSHSSS